MSALRIAVIVLLVIAGLVLVTAGIGTWGINNHVIGFPYKEMLGLGLVLLGLAGWVWFA